MMIVQKVRKSLLLLSVLLFPVTFMYISPAMAIGGTLFRTVSGGLLFWFLVLVTAPFLGRSFCGFLCPLGGVQMACDGALGRPKVSVKYMSAIKWIIWAAWIGLICFFAVQVSGWNKVDLLWENPGFPPYAREAYFFWLGFTLLPVLLVLLLGKRSFCHYLCFFSPLNIIGDRVGRWLRLPRLHLAVASGRCSQCRKCARECPMSLDVPAMVAGGAIDHTECITCGSCAGACKTSAVTWRIGQEKRGA